VQVLTSADMRNEFRNLFSREPPNQDPNVDQ
jgi:hypothetical protein